VQAQATPQPVPQQTTIPVPTPAQQNLPQQVTPTGKPFHIPAAVIYAFVALVLLSITPVAKRVRRSRRRRGPPDGIVVGAFAEFLDRARDLGWMSAPSETHREFARRVAQGNGASHLELASVTSRVLYADENISGQDAAHAWSTLERSLHDLHAHAPWWRRALGELDPRTLLPPHLAGRISEPVVRFVRRYTPTGRPSSIWSRYSDNP
jgi:hypothetical protein